MNLARRKVLAMVHEQKLSVDEAEELLDAMAVAGKAAPSEVPRIELVGESEHMVQLRRTLDKVAATQSSVLIQGEPGTGKALTARYIHYGSSRARGPFAGLDCAESSLTMESEIFGHEEGAFTGAIQSKRGLLDATDGGTLLLSDIDVLALEIQGKLLGYLEDGYFTRVGGTKPVYADVRVIGVAHGDVRSRVDEGRFSSDLYHRLSVCLVQTAPLRERSEDVLVLTGHFLQKQAERDGRAAPSISPAAAELLHSYGWPRNESELSQTIERAMMLCNGNEITPEHLPLLGDSR